MSHEQNPLSSPYSRPNGGWEPAQQQQQFTAPSSQSPQPAQPQPTPAPPTQPQPAQPQAAQPQGFQSQGLQYDQGTQPGSPKDGIKALFDFSFKSYVTPSVAKVVYVLGIIVGIFGYLGSVVGGFITTAGIADSLSYFFDAGLLYVFPIIGIFTNLLGLALWIIALRMVIEMVLAQIRTAQYMRDMTGDSTSH